MIVLENNFNEKLREYARLTVRLGVNLQKGQELVLSCPVECAYFGRMIAEEAYIAGAKEVITIWNDELMTKLKYDFADSEVFKEFPNWAVEQRLMYARRGACFVSIAASDPDLLRDVDPARLRDASIASNTALKEFYDYTMSNQCAWTVISVPTERWAKKVFDKGDDSVSLLWDAILKSVRVGGGNAEKAWDEHVETLKRRYEFLNDKQFSYLHFKNSLGTDFKVGLPKNHIWAGGSDVTQSGIPFIANMPTEEIFTAPDRNFAEGRVVSSMPLSYQGTLIENFVLDFKNGEVVNYSAEKGYDSLKNMLESFDGAKRLGEVALVQYDSPISRMGIIFFNTLFDENASCHLALGKAYPASIENGTNMSEEELERHGLNNSLTHVDFMIGTPDLEITGYDEKDNPTPIFRNGNFVI